MAQLKARRIKKTYLALVQGSVSAAVGRIEAPIGRDPKHRTRMAVVPDGRPSVDRLPGPRAVRRLDAARARPRHRADPPDPGPPRRHRPSGRRRPGLRHRRRRGAGPTASTGCSCTPGGSSSPRRRTATSSGRPRRCRRELESVLEALRAPDGAGAIDAIDPTSATGPAPSRRSRRRAGRAARHHLGPERGGEGHDHRRAAASGRTTRTTTTS